MSDQKTENNEALNENLKNAESGTEEQTEGSASESANEARLDEVVSEWKSKVAYLAAEVENMRKRFAREKFEVIKNANEELLKRLLPVFDNLDLAVKAGKDGISKLEESVKKHPVVDNLVKGVEMTLKHFEQTLEDVGVKAMKTVGEKFNPSMHEAVGQTEETEKADETVTSEFQKGFNYNGKVIRAARVVVNKKTDSGSDSETENSNADKAANVKDEN